MIQTVHAEIPSFVEHKLDDIRSNGGNSWPMWLAIHDVDVDGHKDIIVTHIGGWWDGDVYPYTSWYEGPDFRKEHVMIDKNIPRIGLACRIYSFVLFDVDGDGHKDLIGQGYPSPGAPSNLNKWYKRPSNPKLPWTDWHDYGNDIGNGHDIVLKDFDRDGKEEVILIDSHKGDIIAKFIPQGVDVNQKWPYHLVTEGHGFTHHFSFADMNGDGHEDIVIGIEEDGGNGIRWYENPGAAKAYHQEWKHYAPIPSAKVTKAFARDFDNDGDMDFVGTGEITGYGSAEDIAWYENTQRGYLTHAFDIRDNNNNVRGSHNCLLFDIDNDGDEDLFTGGVNVGDNVQRFRCYEQTSADNRIKWKEHVLAVTSFGASGKHGGTCGETAFGDIDGDGDIDLVYSGQASGYLAWFENTDE